MRFNRLRRKKAIAKILAEARDKVEDLPISEHLETIENYIAILHKSHTLSTKKAFFKGCEFAISFLSEARSSAK